MSVMVTGFSVCWWPTSLTASMKVIHLTWNAALQHIFFRMVSGWFLSASKVVPKTAAFILEHFHVWLTESASKDKLDEHFSALLPFFSHIRSKLFSSNCMCYMSVQIKASVWLKYFKKYKRVRRVKLFFPEASRPVVLSASWNQAEMAFFSF